jgi:hypothetical protein
MSKKQNAFDAIGDMNLENLNSPVTMDIGNNNFFEISIPEVTEDTLPAEDLEEGLESLEDDIKRPLKSKSKVEDLEVEEDDSLKAVEVPTESYDDWSDYSIAVLDKVREGLWDLDEKDIPKDIDAATFFELADAQNKIAVERAREEALSATAEYSEYVKFLIEGGSPEVVEGLAQIDRVIALDTNEEDNQREVLRLYFNLKEMDEDTIDDTIESIIDKGKGKQKSQEAIQLMDGYKATIMENDRKAREQQMQAQKQAYEDHVKTVTGVIRKGKLAGLDITKKKQDQLIDALFKPTEFREVVNPNTQKKERVRMTKSKLLFDEVMRDPEKYAAMVLWLLDGGTFETVKESVKLEKDNNLRDILKGRRTGVAVQKNKENGFEILAQQTQFK